VYRRRVGDGNLRRLQKVGRIDQPKLQVGFCGPRKESATDLDLWRVGRSRGDMA
jgi:hypothetical protein